MGIYTMQAMGKGLRATFMTVCRQGLLNILCLLLMNWLVGLYGMIRTQLIIEALTLPVTDGSSCAASMFTQIPSLGEGKPVEFELIAAEKVGNGGLHLNYLAKNAEQV